MPALPVFVAPEQAALVSVADRDRDLPTSTEPWRPGHPFELARLGEVGRREAPRGPRHATIGREPETVVERNVVGLTPVQPDRAVAPAGRLDLEGWECTGRRAAPRPPAVGCPVHVH